MEPRSFKFGLTHKEAKVKSYPGSNWEFSKKGTALFGQDFLLGGVEYKHLSHATVAAQRLVKEIQGKFMEKDWKFTSVIEMRVQENLDPTMLSIAGNIATIGNRTRRKGERIAIVFTNPSIHGIEKGMVYCLDSIKNERRNEISSSVGVTELYLPLDKKLLEGTGVSFDSWYGLGVKYNRLPNKKGEFLLQRGVVIVDGHLRDTK